jgi:hypothetical protein
MKMVINAGYGGFGLGVAEQHEDWVRDLEFDRFNAELVEFVETYPNECGDLAIVTIPDEATDWEMNEYDGWESVIYVLDGKIIHAECEED